VLYFGLELFWLVPESQKNHRYFPLVAYLILGLLDYFPGLGWISFRHFLVGFQLADYFFFSISVKFGFLSTTWLSLSSKSKLSSSLGKDSVDIGSWILFSS